MKKFICLIGLMITTSLIYGGQTGNEKLKELLDERKSEAGKYLERIEKKSGIFGNQTKKDLKEANEILLKVVETDNRIFGEAERLIIHTNFETTSAGRDLAICEQQKAKLLDTIRNMQTSSDPGSQKNNVPGWIKVLLSITIIYSIVITALFRKRNKM